MRYHSSSEDRVIQSETGGSVSVASKVSAARRPIGGLSPGAPPMPPMPPGSPAPSRTGGWGPSGPLRAAPVPRALRRLEPARSRRAAAGRLPCRRLSRSATRRRPTWHFVGVDPADRGRGLGRELYRRFAALARERGRTVLKAETGTFNRASIALHTRLGFSVEPGDETVDGIPIHHEHGRARTRLRAVHPLATGRPTLRGRREPCGGVTCGCLRLPEGPTPGATNTARGGEAGRGMAAVVRGER